MLLEPAGIISRFVCTQYNQATGVKSPKFPTLVVAMCRLSVLCNVTNSWVATFRQCPCNELRTAQNCFSSHCVPIRGKRPGGHAKLRGTKRRIFWWSWAQLCSSLKNYFVKKVIRTIYMPDSFLFFTAHNKIPDNSSNNNKTDESQVQIPRRSEVNLFFFGGGVICVCWRTDGVGVSW